MFHKGDAAALDGIRDQDFRFVSDGFEFIENGYEGSEIVSVTAPRMPPETPELLLQIAQVRDLAHEFVGLDLVVIHDHVEVRDALVRCVQ